MVCPNCSESMKSTYVDSQFVSHCSSCGCTFFEENSINRVTYDTARSLAEDRYRHFISPAQKCCPVDFSPFVPISNIEAVPSNVTLFTCPACSGVFVYPEDLVKFKRAQGAKIDYYKSWGKPFASLQAVLIIFVITFLGLTSYLTLNTLRNRSLYKSEASDLFKTITIVRSGHYILIGFRTNTPLKSQILLRNNKTSKEIVTTISATARKVHEITVTNIDLIDDYSYRIILTDANGQSITTELKKLVVTIK